MKRRAKTCTACGKPLGEARLVVHSIGGANGEFHVDCFGQWPHNPAKAESQEAAAP